MPGMQEVLAPFALANPGCTGNETRLVACPVQMATQDDRGDINTATCDPFFDTFAFVECRDATLSGTGAASLKLVAICMVNMHLGLSPRHRMHVPHAWP